MYLHICAPSMQGDVTNGDNVTVCRLLPLAMEVAACAMVSIQAWNVIISCRDNDWHDNGFVNNFAGLVYY